MFSHMHMKYRLCVGQSATDDEFWYTTITTVWFERERRDGAAQLQRSGGSAAIVSAFSSLGTGPCCGSPRMGPCFPLRATHAVYWWSWCNLLLCRLCSHRSFESVQRVQARQTYNKHGTLWAFNFISKRMDPFDIATCRPKNSISKGSVQ